VCGLGGQADAETSILRLPGETARLLQALARRLGRPAEDVVAELVAAEHARLAAPSPSAAELSARAAGERGDPVARGTWTVRVVPAAAAELAAYPEALRAAIRDAFAALAADPTRGRSAGDRWRYGFHALGTAWRVVYVLDEAAAEVRVLTVTTRDNAAY
jgi:plasmid stabilization system protein ParE